MKRLVYTRPDGGVSVVCPAPEFIDDLMTYGTTRQRFLAEVGQRIAAGVSAAEAMTGAQDFFGVKTLEEALAVVRAKDIPPDAVNVHECELADLPSSRRFRNCWRQVGAAPAQVDLPLARAQRLNEIRLDRVSKLAQADAAIEQASDQGDVPLSGRLRAYRQALRDVPQVAQPILDALTTPEALEAWMPSWPVEPIS